MDLLHFMNSIHYIRVFLIFVSFLLASPSARADWINLTGAGRDTGDCVAPAAQNPKPRLGVQGQPLLVDWRAGPERAFPYDDLGEGRSDSATRLLTPCLD